KYPLQKHSLNNRKLPPGVIIVPVKQRYREDGFLIHLLGHVGQSLEKPVLQGDAGLEKRYDSTLKGKQAQEVVAVVNGMGQPIAGLTPKSKDDSETVEYAVVTTIDKRTQAIVEKVMDQRVTSGAVVVMNIKNRDILAMASRPTYNPYNPASYQGNTESAWLLNRALTPFYPGSVFKIVVAAAALENHAIDSTAEFYCPGSYRYSSRLTIPCWKQNGHGKVNLEQALAESCNVAFIEMGLKVGRTRLLELCRRVHLAEQEIIGYSDTQSGSHVAIDYGRPALGNATLGQQGVYLTPVQISNLIATLASNGVYKRPRLVIQTWGKGNTRIYYPPDRGEKVLNQAVCNELCRYLCQVTAYGTGKNADLPGVGCGGKTATSQTGHYTSAGEEVLNTWFTGFFPADNPQWVVTVLVEHGQSGGYNAAPVFKEIAEGILEQSAQYEPTLKEKGNKNNLANDL
ncbi:MAG: peptidoglycan D,D-transpeptidase FtsI family protein, partial [Chitinophagales bacterium]